MRVLNFTLIICAFAGLWQPSTWTSLIKHIIYKTYAMFLFSSLYLFAMSQFMNLILYVDNSDEFIETIHMMLTVSVAGFKLASVWINRKNVKLVINTLTEKPFKPIESDEVMIRQKFDKLVQKNTMRYLILVMSSVMSIILTSVFTYVQGNLTYKAWVPFDYSAPAIFLLVYIQQLIGMSTSGIVNVAFESLFCGFLLHICCQLQILAYRLTKISNSRDILNDCVRHHNLIFKYACMVNDMFAKIIALQFAVSMLAVCTNLYQMATTRDNNFIQFIPLMLYTGSMLSQIFIYCWFGNEVKLKSFELRDNIYNMEWPDFTINKKKDLLIIMKRTLSPIEFSSAYIVTMNLDSFLLKLSYSAFHLLHGTQE